MGGGPLKGAPAVCCLHAWSLVTRAARYGIGFGKIRRSTFEMGGRVNKGVCGIHIVSLADLGIDAVDEYVRMR